MPGASPPVLEVEPGRGAPGRSSSFEVRLHGERSVVAATQNEVEFGSGARVRATASGQPDCSVNPEIQKLVAAVFKPTGCFPGIDCEGIKVVVIAFDNFLVIPDGSLLYRCELEIDHDVLPGEAISLDCFDARASDPYGNAVPVGCIGGSVDTTTPPGS